MKILLPLSILILAFCSSTNAQNVSEITYNDLDTLKFYSVGLSAEYNGRKHKYWVDNKRVNRETYDKYKNVWDNIGKCKPCYLKTYDVDDNLLREGVQYSDCSIGLRIEYYFNGQMKAIGYYKKSDLGNIWKKKDDNFYCSLKHGIWTYYDSKGVITYTEDYIDGVKLDK